MTCLLAVFIQGGGGCNGVHDSIRGSGVSVTADREVTPFKKVVLHGVGTLNLTTGDTQRCIVTADDNLVEFIETRVDEDTLVIRCTQSLRPQSELVYDVTAPDFTDIECHGAAEIQLRELEVDTLSITTAGATSVNGDGSVNSLRIVCSGAGSVDLRDLAAITVSITMSGAGSAIVYASESFSAKIAGAASVQCYGDPAHVEQSVAGVGSVKLIRSDAGAKED